MGKSENSQAFDRQVFNHQRHPGCPPCELECESDDRCPNVNDKDFWDEDDEGIDWFMVAMKIAFVVVIAVGVGKLFLR